MKNNQSFVDCENMDILAYLDFLDYKINREEQQKEQDEEVFD